MYHCSRLSQITIVGICIILRISTEFLPVQSNDGEVTVAGEFGSVDRFALVRVSRRSSPQSLGWESSARSFRGRVGQGGSDRCDLVAEEPCRFRSGMGDQGLLG